ncbi:MAG: 50S ribosomal protein L13 [Candidatus ainarchaeum sp.]|nr:50S ribosomal protein L13 [Candidatus ainarchaeum sp.]
MEKIVIDAEGLVFGRIASIAAQKALEGKQVEVLNAEKSIMSGSQEVTLKKFKRWMGMHGKGNPEKGPQFSRMPDKILRNSIRKMLPKTRRGITALRNVMVCIGAPAGKKSNFEAGDAKPKNLKKFVVLGEICKLLGAKF